MRHRIFPENIAEKLTGDWSQKDAFVQPIAEL